MNLNKMIYLRILFTNANFVKRFSILLQIFYQIIEDIKRYLTSELNNFQSARWK